MANLRAERKLMRSSMPTANPRAKSGGATIKRAGSNSPLHHSRPRLARSMRV